MCFPINLYLVKNNFLKGFTFLHTYKDKILNEH